MECIVYFDVVYNQEIKQLRGLIFLDEGATPTEQDFLSMFSDMGFTLKLENAENLVFIPVNAWAEFKEIRIRRLDTGNNEDHFEDSNLKSIITNLLPSKPTFL